MKNAKPQEILSTPNYDMFTLHPNNRPISERRVQKRMIALKKQNLSRYKPIMVNEKNQIIDGQHMFMACKNLGWPIYYVKAELNGKSNEAMATLNENQTQWAQTEWIEHWAKRGKEDYQLIIECAETHKVSLGLALIFVGQGHSTQDGLATDIRQGNFKKGSLSYKRIAEIHKDFVDIFPKANNLTFTRALVHMIRYKKYDHEKDFHRIKLHREDLQLNATLDQYYKMFERMLNFRRRGPKVKIAE